MNRLFVLDAETPWVRSLFQALPAEWSVEYLGARTLGVSPTAWWQAYTTWSPGCEWAPVPGWSRAFRISTEFFAGAVRRRIRAGPRPAAVVHSLPWTAGVIPRTADLPHVYRPHDFFGMYSWNQGRVNALERELCAACRFVAPVSTAHASDLMQLGPAPVVTVPNGVSAEFVRRLRQKPEPPADLPPSARPVVGCVGQITVAYDLDLIGALADAVPEADFVFIGPAFDADPLWPKRVAAALDRPNVRWLGPKPHAELPAYLARFDVCFVPLRVSDHNHRRSPLRLFDYLAADKPVLSTALAAARELEPHVTTGRDSAELTKQLRTILASPGMNLQTRHQFVDAQVWEARGQQFVGLVNEYC